VVGRQTEINALLMAARFDPVGAIMPLSPPRANAALDRGSQAKSAVCPYHLLLMDTYGRIIPLDCNRNHHRIRMP